MSKTRAIKQHIPADAKTGYATPDKPAAGEFANARIAIVATRWNVEIVDALVTGARAALKAWGVAGKHFEFFRAPGFRSEEHTSELQSLMRISYAVFCLKKKNKTD